MRLLTVLPLCFRGHLFKQTWVFLKDFQCYLSVRWEDRVLKAMGWPLIRCFFHCKETDSGNSFIRHLQSQHAERTPAAEFRLEPGTVRLNPSLPVGGDRR